ncbi:MAG: hypothetical protein KAQ63_01745 [Candidatus Moranbacteria bacterium]|nr:hypothetical protein [Candidatus Moranbacteria bacterium]
MATKHYKLIQEVNLEKEDGKEIPDELWRKLRQAAKSFNQKKENFSWARVRKQKKWEQSFFRDLIEKAESIGEWEFIACNPNASLLEKKEAVLKVYEMAKDGEILHRWERLPHLIATALPATELLGGKIPQILKEAKEKISSIRSARRRKRVGPKWWQTHDKIQNILVEKEEVPDKLWGKLLGLTKNFQQLGDNLFLANWAESEEWKKVFLDEMFEKAKWGKEWKAVAWLAEKNSKKWEIAVQRLWKGAKGENVLYRLEALNRILPKEHPLKAGVKEELKRVRKERREAKK